MKTQKIFLVHGYKGSPQIPKWFSWLKNQWTELEVIAPQFPDPAHPQVKDWISTIENYNLDEEKTIFVGHSLGGLAVLRYIQEHDLNGKKAKAIILVATPMADVGKSAIVEFLPPLKREKIKEKTGQFIQIYSKDDPYVPSSHGEEAQRMFGGELIMFDDRSHFEKQETFQEIKEVIGKILLQKDALEK